jgi:2-oxoglutarate ferredoxin oxidoreductase subunit beta
VAEIRRARQAIQRAFTVQLRGLGLGIVELLGACPTNWQVSPVEALEFIERVMLPVYPLGEFKVAAELGA